MRLYSARIVTEFDSDTAMNDKHPESEVRIDTLKNAAARQRWQLFHRAIAYAKATNAASTVGADGPCDDPDNAAPYLTLVR